MRFVPWLERFPLNQLADDLFKLAQVFATLLHPLDVAAKRGGLNNLPQRLRLVQGRFERLEVIEARQLPALVKIADRL